jgi:hypothetical protein
MLAIVRDLFINKANGQIEPLATSLTNIAQPNAPDYVSRDVFTQRIWFCDPGPSIYQPLQANPIDAGDSIVFDGKPASDPTAADALFSATDFEEVQIGVPLASIAIPSGQGGAGYSGTLSVAITGGGGSGATATATASGGVITAIVLTNPGSGYTSLPTVEVTGSTGGAGCTPVATLDGLVQTYYEATCDLTPDNLAAAIAATGNGQLQIVCGVQVQNAGNTARLTYVFAGIVQATPWTGAEGAPATGDPPYPPPASILVTGDLATEAAAQAGTDNATVMTPLRTAQAIAALADAAGAAAAAQAAAVAAAEAASLQKSANLSDLANAATARGNLGLGTAATMASGAFDAAGAAAAAQAAAEAACATSAQGAEADALTAAFAASPIQPVSAIATVFARLLDGSYNLSGNGHLDLSGLGLTAIDPGLIVQWLVQAIQYDGGDGQTIDLSGNALSLEVEDSILAALLANSATSGGSYSINLSGGSNASLSTPMSATLAMPATPVPYQDEAFFRVSNGSPYSPINLLAAIDFDSSIPLSGSNVQYSDGNNTVYLGIADSPSQEALAAELASLCSGFSTTVIDNGDGTVSISDANAADLPFGMNDYGSGIVASDVDNGGYDANATTLVSNGVTINSN